MTKRKILTAKFLTALALTATTTVTLTWATPVFAGNSGDYLAARQARMAGDFDAAVYYYIRALGDD
ncbi:MAG: hypothetical protein VX622_14155, partial [Pseudomonadota bacterium]|nr:hypothetical protein [Pseudomonadota bacterium]